MAGPAKARRHPARPWWAVARRAVLALCLLPGLAIAQEREWRPVLGATYVEPTTRYAHGVLGDAVEWGGLLLRIDRCPQCARVTSVEFLIRLPENRVFEDIAPRLADVDRRVDGNEVIVVESDLALGARLAIYGEHGLIAATPFIGRANRWLAPLGAADLDGDGRVEIAYIDRPHLAKTLRVWRFENGALHEVATLKGLTNHRIGEDFISGGIRRCGTGPEIVTADANWRRVVVTRLTGDGLSSRDIGPFSGPQSLEAALACEDVS